MGKESLIKSTSKKTTPKKTKTAKKSAPKSTSGTKTSKKAGTKTKAAKAPKAAAKPTAKPAAGTRKAASIQDLLFKKFAEHPVPADLAGARPDFSKMTAPPLIDTDDPKEAERLRGLLSLKFSMAEIKAVAKPPVEIKPADEPPAVQAEAPEKAKTPKEAPNLQDLLFKKFAERPIATDSGAPMPDFSKMTAPPLIDTDDPKETERLRSLLSLKFSMAEIKAVAKPPVERKPADEPSTVQVETVETIETPKPEEPQPEPPGAAAPEPEPPKPAAPQTTAPIAEEKPREQKPAPVIAKPEPKPVQATDSPAHPPAPTEETEASIQVDPVVRSAKIGLTVIMALFLLILWASFNNSTKYFVISKRGSVEIWRGEFSPTGKEFFAVLHGLEPETPIKEEYSRKEIYPMIFNYYLEKADSLIDVSELPDYKSVLDYLQKAKSFALDAQMREAVSSRLINIQRLTLLYKADVEAGKGTAESMEAAIDSLRQAQRLTNDPSQVEVINQKINALMARKAALEKEAESAPPAAEQPPTQEKE